MEINTEDITKRVNLKELDVTHGQMAVFTRVSLEMVWEQERVDGVQHC